MNRRRDRSSELIVAIVVIGTLAVIIGNLLSDILYAAFDPRVRFN